MITPIFNRTSSDARMTYTDMNRICSNINEICGGALKTTWTNSDIVDEGTWCAICDLARSLGRYPVTYDADYINVNHIERSLFDQYDATHHITASPKLTGLSIEGVTLYPAFNETTYIYTAEVAEPASSITATTDYSAVGYMVNSEVVNPEEIHWQEGENTLEVTATLNGSTVTYTVTVTCSFRSAKLLTLTIGDEQIGIADFMTAQTENSSDSITFTATGAVAMTLNGETVTGSTLNWQENTNTLLITVTADDVKTYTLAVDCLYEAPIPAYLGGIDISDATIIPAFSSQVFSYDVYPDADVSVIDVISEEEDFTITLNGIEIEDGSEIEWTEGGGDVIQITTAASDSYTSVTYTITSRAEIVVTNLAPMQAGEIVAGDIIPGEA